MGLHEEFVELCAAATAGELNVEEQARLDAHLATCAECRLAMSEYEATTRATVADLAQELAPASLTACTLCWPLAEERAGPGSVDFKDLTTLACSDS